ncbi:glutamate-5-semialdehyde dehydrogenase [Lacimicrobium alkaliphilum]|uniref:Gamma-glutamyl phosphate reductase n=1 Tax=Lacimicrobium alkaliphilum TaxID=1526571 RepID=A0A0U3B1B1_9ALTE|nr:glutamate-5-semialdehyde dehydrogenase [Lacimicrobium alkaliphilum]ALT00192.1 gamma-glutamyl-phosphate reductase [Lacimicrobium alkaliphilum]
MTFSIKQMAQKARIASRQLAKLTSVKKNAVLHSIADNLESMTDSILAANKKDVEAGRQADLAESMLDRLTLSKQAIANIADAVRQIAAQDDPVGSIRDIRRQPSGIEVGKMRIPLGVIAMIYESRPNVTIDAAALCFKAGNAVVLRGGKEALHSNLALAECIKAALQAHNVDPNVVVVVPDPDRAIMNELMTLNEEIDLIIPRGGEGLIRFVSENSRIPVIQHYKGVCHLYVDNAADEAKALGLLQNGKTQRTGVCNALETLLVHKDIAPSFLPMAAAMLAEHKVTVHACAQSIDYFEGAEPATDEDWDTEYLALEIAVRVVDSFDAAVEHLEQYSSGHTEVIATQDYSRAQQFIRSVNSAVVMANASSRFSDGGELGLGAEIGISTSKLHAYGPMGAESLTTEKFIVLGDGHIRQ